MVSSAPINANSLSSFYSLQNDKTLDWSKLKAFADNKIKVLKIIIFVFDYWVENTLGKGENVFSKGFLNWVIKSRDRVVKS